MNRQFLLFFTSTILFTSSISAQTTVPNPGFEQTDNSSATKTAYWKPESDDFVCVADNNQPYKGTYSLKLTSKTAGNHFFMYEFPFQTKELKKYKIRCAYRAKHVNGEVWLGTRVFDKEGNTITKTIFKLTQKADQDWTIGEAYLYPTRMLPSFVFLVTWLVRARHGLMK